MGGSHNYLVHMHEEKHHDRPLEEGWVTCWEINQKSMLLSGLELIFGPFDGSIFWLSCIHLLPLLFYLTQMLIPHLNPEEFAWRSNKTQTCAASWAYGGICPPETYPMFGHIWQDLRERECTSANTFTSLPFTEQRSAPASGGTDTRPFIRTSKLLQTAVQRRNLRIKIGRWPRRAALVPSGLAEIYPSAEGRRSQQRWGDARTVDGR